ncbi:hypothetical protein OH805_15510 [Streptomyces sp. NBC_00879]|uniref:hypothetical protein n=1 Tax=Streptomyces sp. NBC_00879 TaxID=2975855 RepID=UPI00386604A2|nr:hypothetical protein OH805_15510 [Streptomyces sp. NBC_00879]
MAASVVVVLLAIGATAWWWTSRDKGTSAVAVPERICGGTLPGKEVAALLPKEGDEFKEKLDLDFISTSNSWCGVTAGGSYIDFDYWWDRSEAWTEELTKESKKSGNTPIELGATKGYASGRGATLFVDCPSESGLKKQVKVQVTLMYQAQPDSEKPQTDFAALVGDATRYVAKQLKCEGAARLPGEVPTVG